MNKVHDITGLDRSIDQLAEQVSRDRLPTSGGGGTFDGMGPQIARLEANMENAKSELARLIQRADKVDDRLGRIDVSIATMSERISHLPSKGFIVSVVLSSFAILGALTIFDEKIKALLGL